MFLHIVNGSMILKWNEIRSNLEEKNVLQLGVTCYWLQLEPLVTGESRPTATILLLCYSVTHASILLFRNLLSLQSVLLSY